MSTLDIGIKGQIIYIGYTNIQDQTSDGWNVINGSGKKPLYLDTYYIKKSIGDIYMHKS
jgi:hypothetical protein